VIGDTVLVIDHGGEIHALDVSDGSLRWSYDVGGRSSATPAVAGDRLYVGDGNGWLHALNLDGTEDEPPPPPAPAEPEESPFVELEQS